MDLPVDQQRAEPVQPNSRDHATQLEARALADPTRLRILRHLTEAARPVDIEELTRVAEVHHNAVRSHLHRLVEAGLAVESVQRRIGRGRPRLQYTAGATASQRLRGVTGYEELARSLSRTIVGHRSPREQGAADGAAIAANLAPELTDDPVAAIEHWARAQGFAPRVEADPDDPAVVDVHIHACPYADVAKESPEVVCALHLGMAEGLAIATGGRVEGLEVRDPVQAGCVLRVRR